MALTTRPSDPTTPARLYVSLELSKDTWKLASTTGRGTPARIRDVPARDRAACLREIDLAKRRFGLPATAEVCTCYEAGRDGFWIHRFLEAEGIRSLIVDPASIEVSRRKRRVKTDRVDAQKLVQLLVRHHEGEDVLSVVHVPPPEIEDERLLTRRLRTLKEKRTRQTNAMRALLFQHGVDLDPSAGSLAGRSFLREVARVRRVDGSPLPPGVLFAIEQEWELYEVVARQIKDLEQRQREALRRARRGEAGVTKAQKVAALLTRLRGIGDTGAYVLSLELFAWRDFENRRQVGALAGLTGTPYQSGGMDRDQGISKAGNGRVRALIVELAWLWLRHQPQSDLTKWFHAHVGQAQSRNRRKAIVALARKLLIALWRFADHGVTPAGATLKAGFELAQEAA